MRHLSTTIQYARIQKCPKGAEKRQNSGVFQNGEIWRFSNFTPKTANIFSTTSGPEMG